MESTEQVKKSTKHYNPFEICRDYLRSPKSAYLINVKWRDKFFEALSTMDKCICDIQNEKGYENFLYTIVEECLNFLKSIMVEKNIDESYRKFLHTFLYIAHNVNTNTDNHTVIEQKISLLQRFCDRTLTLSETTSLMKVLTDRIYHWKDWSPPSFRLSQHYFKTFKE